MMSKAPDSTDNEGAADFSADFSRLAAEMLENARALPRLMVNPAAAMAAATAIGFGFSSQMAGAFFGALQGAMEATNKLKAVLDETPPDEGKPGIEVKPENIRSPPAKKVASKVKLAIVPVSGPDAPKAKPTSRAGKVDDLKRIPGVGPKLAQVLNARGIRTFADIAAWSDDDIARIEAELGFDGRIVRDGWTTQAKALAARSRKRT